MPVTLLRLSVKALPDAAGVLADVVGGTKGVAEAAATPVRIIRRYRS
jgi:hypothetical protein